MSRIMIIGIDGASWTAIKPLISNGTMPFLKEMVKGGSSGILRSVIPPVTAPAWSSFMTGKHPDMHGVFEFRCFDVEKKADYLTNSSYIQSETIWQILSRHNKKIISMNVPYTYPVYDVNGILISGMDTPSKDSSYCNSPSIKEIINKKYPDYVPVMDAWDMKKVSNETNALKYIMELEKIIDVKVKVAQYLLSEYEWDVSMVHFQETDYIQHALWDKIAESVNGVGSKPLHEAIRNFYRKIDNSIGSLWDIADSEETSLIIISDHGFTDHRGVIFPNVAHEKSGLLMRENNNLFLSNLKKSMKNSDNPFIKLGYSLQKKVRDALRVERSVTTHEKIKQRSIYESIPVMWDKSYAVMVMGSQNAFIYIKDENYAETCKDILKNMCNEKGEPVFDSILSLNKAYGRTECDKGNMLIAIPREGYSVSRMFHDVAFEKNISFPGIHHPEGVFIAYGNNIKGELRNDLCLIDIVPTCLYLLGLPVPSDMDGKVAGSILKKEGKVLMEEVVNRQSPEKRGYDEESEEMVKERLRSLGYIE